MKIVELARKTEKQREKQKFFPIIVLNACPLLKLR